MKKSTTIEEHDSNQTNSGSRKVIRRWGLKIFEKSDFSQSEVERKVKNKEIFEEQREDRLPTVRKLN